MKLTKKQQQTLSRELFKMAYQWGIWKIDTDWNSQAWQTEVGRLLGNEPNGFHRVGNTIMECFILECKKKHLPF